MSTFYLFNIHIEYVNTPVIDDIPVSDIYNNIHVYKNLLYTFKIRSYKST